MLKVCTFNWQFSEIQLKGSKHDKFGASDYCNGCLSGLSQRLPCMFHVLSVKYIYCFEAFAKPFGFQTWGEDSLTFRGIWHVSAWWITTVLFELAGNRSHRLFQMRSPSNSFGQWWETTLLLRQQFWLDSLRWLLLLLVVVVVVVVW